jgi:DNA modification methylase
MKKNLRLYCVDIEIWIKSNPVPTGLRVACQDAYEYNLWFSKAPKWSININSIRRPYANSSLKIYQNTVYKPRRNGLQYVSKKKTINPNEFGALPINIYPNEIENLAINIFKSGLHSQLINNETNLIYGAVSNKTIEHQAVQPEYLPEKYILACTSENDIVLDPWVGSGTTGIVALKLNRKFIGIDISQEFSELAEKNIKALFESRKQMGV